MWENAIELIKEGVTTSYEVLRVINEEDYKEKAEG